MVRCSQKDERYASLAFSEALKSSMLMKHGCIAVVNGKIVARGHNHYRTYSKDRFICNCCSCHAEVDVLRKCSYAVDDHRIHKIVLYIVRISNEKGKHSYQNSAPCTQCRQLMLKMKIKYMIYSDSLGMLVKCKIRDFHVDHQSSGQSAIVNGRVTCGVF